MKVIMISGKSGSGKNALAAIFDKILNEKNNRVLTIAFGDLVKTFLKQYYGWNGEKDQTGRKMLQELGTDKMRAAFPTYWADVVAKFIIATSNDWDYVLIPDWRFKNEFSIVYELNSGINKIYRVRIERENYRNPNMTDEQYNHISETALDNTDFDWIIDNKGNLFQLEAYARMALLYIDNH